MCKRAGWGSLRHALGKGIAKLGSGMGLQELVDVLGVGAMEAVLHRHG